MFEYRIKTTPTGRQQFVRSQSFSHHHDHDHHRHHYRTRCFDNCAGISLDQWNTLCGQNKTLIGDNDALTRENQTLKSDLQATSQENGRLIAYNQQMIDEIEVLRRSHSHDSDTTERFRRRVAALKTEVDNKDREIRRIEKENDTFATRIRVLTQTVSDHARRIADMTTDLINWEKRSDKFEGWYNDMKSKFENVRRLVASQTRELDDKNILIEEQRRMIRRLETALPPPRRRYSCV
ncbi:hypothetical protein F4820DRAFT_402551 [Hypoxylon rubiginosum]|uniref:Uncharacterized protein n=1 Tax=Hypoxylon rubiginosum TaxID=110542 RepID=A0ACB9ZH84_9PEZI|nr:hypothetical protein F4820DRAFT_402551 [Hypoxylon rubiginosum]